VVETAETAPITVAGTAEAVRKWQVPSARQVAGRQAEQKRICTAPGAERRKQVRGRVEPRNAEVQERNPVAGAAGDNPLAQQVGSAEQERCGTGSRTAVSRTNPLCPLAERSHSSSRTVYRTQVRQVLCVNPVVNQEAERRQESGGTLAQRRQAGRARSSRGDAGA